MASVNKVILVGNIGRTPEVRYTPEGTAMCNVSIATSSKWKDKATGEHKEDTEWHRLVFRGRIAEVVGEHAYKGRSIYVEGKLKTRKWIEKGTSAERFTTEVLVDTMQLLGNPAERGQP